MEALLKSCGQEGLFPAFEDLGLTSVEDVSLCEPPDLESDLGIDHDVAEEIVEKAKEQYLFEKRRAAVQSTWKTVEDALNVEATKLFYKHLFETHPEVKPMFENADMDSQAEKLYKTVGLAVKYLDDVEGLIPVLQEMGVKHAKEYGTKQDHFTAVGDALLWTLKTGLGKAWTPEVADAWTWVYGVIAKTMGDAGDACETKEDDASLSVEEKKKIVKETWSKVEPIAEHATKIFYRDLHERDSKAKELFASTDMEAQEEKLAKTLGIAVKNLDDLDGLVPVLEEMAVRHVDFGVTKEMYGSVGASLLKTLEIGLGDDWTPEVKESWTWVYTLMSDVMVTKAYPE